MNDSEKASAAKLLIDWCNEMKQKAGVSKPPGAVDLEIDRRCRSGDGERETWSDTFSY